MTLILLLLLAYCCSVLFAWHFIPMKHLGFICVFSCDSCGRGRWQGQGSWFERKFPSIQSVRNTWGAERIWNKVLFILNPPKCCCSIPFFKTFSRTCECEPGGPSLNWPGWTGPVTLDLSREGDLLKDSECYGAAPLLLHQHCRAHNGCHLIDYLEKSVHATCTLPTRLAWGSFCTLLSNAPPPSAPDRCERRVWGPRLCKCPFCIIHTCN